MENKIFLFFCCLLFSSHFIKSPITYSLKQLTRGMTEIHSPSPPQKKKERKRKRKKGPDCDGLNQTSKEHGRHMNSFNLPNVRSTITLLSLMVVEELLDPR